jgi:Flp pilus assembly protein TadD
VLYYPLDFPLKGKDPKAMANHAWLYLLSADQMGTQQIFRKE